MARIGIHLPSLLHSAVDGQTRIAVEATTLRGCLDALIADYPRMGPHLFDDSGTLRPHVNIFLNDDNVRWLESWDLAVSDGDSVTILQAVSGG